LAKGLRFRLLAPSEEDAAKASIGIMGNKEQGGIHQARRDNFKKDAKSKFSAIMSSSIFGATGGAHSGGAGSGLKRKEPSSSASASSSSALMALRKKSAPGGGNKSSKALLAHDTKQALAIKRDKQGINTSLFSLSKSSSAAAAAGGSALPMPIIRKKKK
jgi:hypothetical protein